MTRETSTKTANLAARRPIGLFDSGVGGLTVVGKIRERLPDEALVYFGDTARVPYGTKSHLTVRRYAAEDTRLLLQYQPKLIIVACNTVSALALDVVEHESNGLPVLGVLKAGAELAVKHSRSKRIGVIGTSATIASNAYQREIAKLDHEAQVYAKACPLFVPLAEEGFVSHRATRLIAREYLAELLAKKIDVLVLGCTHYPILKPMLAEVAGKRVTVIDSAEAVALAAENLLGEKSLLHPGCNWVNGVNEVNKVNEICGVDSRLPKVLVSDLPQKYQAMFERFLGVSLPEVELIDLSSLNDQSYPSIQSHSKV